MEPSPPFPGLIVRDVRNERELLCARRLHASCYLAADYIGKSDHSPEGTIDDRWVPFSDYLIAVDTETNQIVGTARLVRASIRGFPIAHHGPLFPDTERIFSSVDPTLCLEASALATARKGIQNALISSALYQRIGEIAVSSRKAYLFGILDKRLLRFMRKSLVFPFEPIGPSMPERSHSTTPMAVYLPRAYQHWIAEQPEIMEMFADGKTFKDMSDLVIDLREKAPNDIPVVGSAPTTKLLVKPVS